MLYKRAAAASKRSFCWSILTPPSRNDPIVLSQDIISRFVVYALFCPKSRQGGQTHGKDHRRNCAEHGRGESAASAAGAEDEPADAFQPAGDPGDLHLPGFHLPHRGQTAHGDGHRTVRSGQGAGRVHPGPVRGLRNGAPSGYG